MLRTLGTILKWAILLPVLIAVVLLAVANDQVVTVRLNPFDTSDPVLRLDLALYQIAFLLFVLGALVGGLVAWRGQRKHRLRARDRQQDAALWQSRAERPDRRNTAPAAPVASGFLPRPERG
ncbi:MAG: DUF1049 domain-containing protein [Propylenella sp.]